MDREAGGVAQLGEHLPCKQGVRSSILLISTINMNITRDKLLAYLFLFCMDICFVLELI